jgi:hypothetical protein
MYGAFCFVAVVGLWWVLQGVLDDKASRVRDAKIKLSAVTGLIGDYEQAKARVDAQESRLRQYQSQKFSAYLEGIASKHSISDNLREVNVSGTPEVVGNIKQTTHIIEIKKAEYEPLFRFLHELETSGYPAKIETANFKSSFKRREKFLDVRLECVVSSLAGV